jgi:peroxiredoxin
MIAPPLQTVPRRDLVQAGCLLRGEDPAELGLDRGSWCPYCNAQLAAFSRALATLTELGVKVVALSLDNEETSAALIAKHQLRFPVGHSADAGKVAAVTGAYLNNDPHYLQSTGFVLAPDGTVRVAVYSSDAIGRLVADDVAGYIRYLTGHAA